MDFATALLPKLAQLLQEDYNLQMGAKKDIQFLSSELETAHTALRKLGQVPREQLDELQRIWARDVREMSYDMEDIVDAFMVRVEGPDPHSKSSAEWIFNLKYMIQKFSKAMARREVAQRIKDIKERAKELAKRRDRYKVDDIAPAKKTSVDPRLNALYNEATKIVGIEEAKKEVTTMLTEGDRGQQKRIVSIAGFGGLGKTTLAKAVYDEIKKDFGCTAFVLVSRNPDTKKLLKDMLYALDKKKFKDEIHSTMLDERPLIDRVREFLQDKRYLIVIDDIWDKEPWDKVIGLALIENNMRSRIITTTRNIDVAEHVGGCYRLRPLSDESSKILFYGRIFGSRDKWQFSEVSKKILKKCGGVPLAIITTSSLLANKSEYIKEWNKVCDSIGLGLRGSNASMDDMRSILLLSYYDLPSHLKTCLLYLSIFPEDYKIRKDLLIWRWIAEGFIQRDQQVGNQSFLEIGESYFNELLNRSLIQPAHMDMEGTPQACHVHDTVLDLIISLSVEECFIATVLGDGMESKVRRLSLHHSTTWPTMKMPKLRSLTIFKAAGVVIDPTPSLSRYHLLRVLDLGGCRLKDLASLGFLGSLSHLRYLVLSRSFDRDAPPDQLPVEVGKLRFLQMLDLSETAVKELPSSVITGLGQLMCLRGANFLRTRTGLPDGLKKLTSLEVLESTAVTSECIAEELGHLTQLRVLEVGVNPPKEDNSSACAKALLGSLGKLSKIESLRIHCRLGGVLDLDGSMEEPLGNLRRLRFDLVRVVPTWIKPASLPGLSYLDIEVYQERREDIQVLGTLPCLCHLKFKAWHPPKPEPLERPVVGPDAFPCVIRCEFHHTSGGGYAQAPCMFPRGAMPRLQHFTFTLWGGGGCTVDDLGLGHLPSLRSVTVVGYYVKVEGMREKLEHEAAVHPNGPLRIKFGPY